MADPVSYSDEEVIAVLKLAQHATVAASAVWDGQKDRRTREVPRHMRAMAHCNAMRKLLGEAATGEDRLKELVSASRIEVPRSERQSAGARQDEGTPKRALSDALIEELYWRARQAINYAKDPGWDNYYCGEAEIDSKNAIRSAVNFLETGGLSQHPQLSAAYQQRRVLSNSRSQTR